MRFRGKSIRRKIVALLLVPLVSLTAIWGFATFLTGREANKLIDTAYILDDLAGPLQETAEVVQEERRQTLVYLADPRASDALAALRRSREATDRLVAKIESKARNSDAREVLDGQSEERLSVALDAFKGLDALRRTVEEGTISRDKALKMYTRLTEPCFGFLMTLNALDDVGVTAEGRALVGIGQARELLSREDALIGSALVAGTVTKSEVRQVSDLVAQRGVLLDNSLTQLPDDERARFERYWNGAETSRLRDAERSLMESGGGTPRAVTSSDWDRESDKVLTSLADRTEDAVDRLRDRARPQAISVIVQLAVVGVLGLIAVLLSLFLSVRIGRSLIRDLRRLRLEAHEASGVRLPGLLRRLAAGEQVDVETEAPRLTYDKDEIGQVGQALNTLQRAAVEATVKQADLRRGVSEVFVNLARRSQVLLHKQLTLLDTMERRTEDTDELADLFRLDHLTTRMRRHAEGLVILSGAAPSRQWRKPVQLMDVVRAAVAEVEDYERIEVRRLPRIAVTGPAVADLTHLLAELLENATVFSPPHTAVQVLGEHVANGFTLEIHDRGLGMASEALLDANLRLAETPEFELSDTDRLGLFVVSRLAQRQRVRVSLQPSPYGGTTAVVFIPESLLTDDVPDTGGVGFRLDRPQPQKAVGGTTGDRDASLAQTSVELPGLPASLLDGPVELEAPVGMAGLDGFPGALEDEDSERGGLFRPRRRVGETAGEQHQQARDAREPDLGEPVRAADSTGHDALYPDEPLDVDDEPAPSGTVPLARRRTPKLVSSHGRRVGPARTRDTDVGPARTRDTDVGPARDTDTADPDSDATRARRESGAGWPGRGPARDSRPMAQAPTDTRSDVGPARGALDKRVRDGLGTPARTSRDAPGSTGGTGVDLPRRPRPDTGWPDLTPPRPLGPDTPSDPQPLLPRRRPVTDAPRATTRTETAPGADRAARTDRGPMDRAAGSTDTPPRTAGNDQDAPTVGGLPRRVRQANLAPQLKESPDRRTELDSTPARAGAEERDADEVRSRMASLQRGWQRGREENAVGEDVPDGEAPGTTSEGDGR
ncbi:sensor histidine kinase [Streptomyces flavofungini]|uniref:sensor histidine kinase n=1 Tax=Streptomyces flavofungini TaxID=68200 RepID=UPI0025B22F1E|nr:nitrate- and nitrite sensing domain-containing protein [Streptomyces flavofungini]WJV50132.1 nitrate- and nitrite sensing domain-containing protein [Streptomyces flavofungini]